MSTGREREKVFNVAAGLWVGGWLFLSAAGAAFGVAGVAAAFGIGLCATAAAMWRTLDRDLDRQGAGGPHAGGKAAAVAAAAGEHVDEEAR